jgi:S-adenosylmethionine decarboxylase
MSSEQGPVAVAAPGAIGDMCSSQMDAWFTDGRVLTDEQALLSVMRDAAAAGHATVVGEASAIFPNGAVTAVLLLAESHLSVHTWPEHNFATFDVLTCGKLSAESIFSHLRSALGTSRTNIVSARRSVH